MASFEEILNRPATDFSAPEPLPVGTYHCFVDGKAEPGVSSNQNTYLQFKFKIVAPYKGVDAKEAAEAQVVGKIITNNYYVTDKATWRLTEMLMDHLDIEPGPENNRKKLTEMLDEAPGKQLLVELKHEMSPDGKRKFQRVNSTAHV
jgi:hypothetical protein